TYELILGQGLMPAHGNIGLRVALRPAFVTFGPLKLDALARYGLPGSYGGGTSRFKDGDPKLVFNNPVTAGSASANITIAPSPKPWATLVQSNEGSTEVFLDPAAFDPAKKYTITIGASLTDTSGQ